MRQVDARLALIRNAVAGDAEPPRVSPLKRRASVVARMEQAADAMCPITDEKREDHHFEFEERVSVYVYEGMPERCRSKSVMPDCCAYHRVLLEVGCVEIWAWEKMLGFLRGLVRPIPTPQPVGLCSRCSESVGHAVERCPFSVGDAEVMQAARERRERRAGREAAA
jgi:hypothetical protein